MGSGARLLPPSLLKSRPSLDHPTALRDGADHGFHLGQGFTAYRQHFYPQALELYPELLLAGQENRQIRLQRW